MGLNPATFGFASSILARRTKCFTIVSGSFILGIGIMYYEYTTRLVPDYNFGGYYLRLTTSNGREEKTTERKLHIEELTVKGLFDLIFDDMKRMLKHELENAEV